jgi:hypothetical protein
MTKYRVTSRSLALSMAAVLSMTSWTRVAQAQVAFEDVSTPAGFDNSYTETWGASWGDLNGDGYPDLFINNHRTRAALYRNNRDGTFTDVSKQVDLSKTPGWTGPRPEADTHGATWADIDNDGDEDLYESVSSGIDHVFINNNGLLTNKALAYGIDKFTERATRQTVLLDFNGDGLLDLASMSLTRPSFYPQLKNGTFGSGSGVEIPLFCSSDTTWGHLVDVDPHPGLEMLCAPRKELYPKSVTAFSNGQPINVSAGFPRWDSINDAATLDYDRDLQPDIFMVRSSERVSDAYQTSPTRVEVQLITAPGNTKSIRFKTTGVLTITAGLRAGSIDPNGDPREIDIGSLGYSPTALTFDLQSDDPRNAGIRTGADGINVGYLTSSGEWMISQGNSRSSYSYVQVTSTAPITNLTFTGASGSDRGYAPILAHHTQGGFETATQAGFNSLMRCQSAVAGDFDNDMDEDIFLACTAGSHNLPDRLFLNNSNGTFTEAANAAGAAGVVGAAVGDKAGTGESVVSADYDVDGFLDLLVTNGNNLQPAFIGGPKQLFHNTSQNGNHWIELDLIGTASNRDAIGSQVYVTTPDGTKQYREQNGGYHRWSQNFQRVHVGLGPNMQADLRIVWPNGDTTQHAAVASGKVYLVKQDGTIAERFSTLDADADGLPDQQEATIGTDPHNPDTDADGLSDGSEVLRGTNPLNADTDGEGLKDGDEVNVYKTNPLVKDTDKDTLNDRVEVVFKHTDPLKPDTDGDGLTDGKEAGANGLGTNPLNPDTDGGGVDDGTEVARGTDPKNPADD